MIRLFGRNNSIAVQKVLWTAGRLNLADKVNRINAGGKFGLPDNYSDINPNKKVPTLVDTDGFSIWESHAVCKYLVRKYGALIDQWMDWKATTLYPHIQVMFVTMVRTEPEKRNWDLYNAAVKESNNKWKIVDDAMRRHGMLYVCDDNLTLADIPLAICYHRWKHTTSKSLEGNFSTLDTWYLRLSQDEFFKKFVLEQPLT